ncbi:hypothetical protein ROHU_021255 [Labeo rohita]|uniref:Uncharacterized protein n=1 Tax=Labeo rohita TaxID=84645 RepID=A0A498MVM1_LABRO|nr:hypothetical protein ROHU_021255 [Labeo rohita]
MNPQTGDLIISNIRGIQSGDYKVEIKTRRMILHRKYHITVIGSDRNSGYMVLMFIVFVDTNDCLSMAVSGPGLFPGAVAVIVVVLVAAGVTDDLTV